MRSIIIDDEKQARDTLEVFLREYCPEVTLCGTAHDGESGLELIKQKHPDLVFLDIEMPDMTGIDLLRKLGRNNPVMIIFVTAHHKYAEAAFDFAALDFLRKPVEPTRLIRAVYKALQHQKSNHLQQQYDTLLALMSQSLAATELQSHPIVFASQHEKVFKKVGMIVYIEAQNNACNVKLADEAEPIYIFKTLKDYELMFDEYPFMMRVHNSFIVNLYHVKKFVPQDFVLVMSDQTKVPLAESKKKECMDRLAALGM